MIIISTNLAQPKMVSWRGQKVSTGIFKYPVKEAILLKADEVDKDLIADKRVHGGEFKACYLFSSKYYNYWKKLYPNLDWNWGMFGENLTVEGLDESKIHVGDIYKVGNALVQITQPREPCFKLGIRFETQQILKQFIEHGHPGTYVKIVKEGTVKTGDTFELEEKSKTNLTTQQLYQLYFSEEKNKELLKLAIESEALPEKKRLKLAKWL